MRTHTQVKKKKNISESVPFCSLIQITAIEDYQKFASCTIENNDDSLPPFLIKPVPESILRFDFPDGMHAYLDARATQHFQPLLPTDLVDLEKDLTQTAILINYLTLT